MESGEVDLGDMGDFHVDLHLGMLQMWTRGCDATDPRDKVFALMNIALGSVSSGPRSTIPLRYRSCTVGWLRFGFERSRQDRCSS